MSDFRPTCGGDAIDRGIEAAAASKILKVFPQRYANAVEDHEFVVWVDSKYAVNTEAVELTVAQWPHGKALLARPHLMFADATGCGSARSEFKEAMKHERYRRQKARIVSYMAEQGAAGLASDGHRHFATGLLLWRLGQPGCATLQDTWHGHIGKCGIECQISFCYIAQLFEERVGQLGVHQWVRRTRSATWR
jgi:hypothetical protein